MKYNTIILTCAAALLCTGCASIVSRTSREVNLRSHPEGAAVSVVDRQNQTIFRGETPTIVTLKTGRAYGTQRYTVTFCKDGYQDQSLTVHSAINGWYLGNLVFGGLIGLAIVDPMTGAMWTLSPKDLDATLVSKTASVSPGNAGLQIVQLEDVPAHLRAQMVPLK